MFNLNLNSLQKKFSLTSNYLGTSSVIVKRVACIQEHFRLDIIMEASTMNPDQTAPLEKEQFDLGS